MKQHQEVVIRLAEVPGLGVDSAQQVIAEAGLMASTFPSAAKLISWVGACLGNEQSTGQTKSSRSAKGNEYLRWDLNQAANAAVKKKRSRFQSVFRCLLPRLGYQAAVRTVTHRLCGVIWRILDQRIRATGQRIESEPKLFICRAKSLTKQLREFSYNVEIISINTARSRMLVEFPLRRG